MSNIQERIDAFTEVQSLTYRLSLEGDKFCSCKTKCDLLSSKFEDLKLPSRPRYIEFSWEDLSLPKDIINIPHDNPELHQYLEVKVPESPDWINVDPTWDPKLKDVFQIPSWDGVSSSEVAVPVKRTLTDIEAEELDSRLKLPGFVENWISRNKDFVQAVDSWLIKMRT